jgi:hypothetical protein
LDLKLLATEKIMKIAIASSLFFLGLQLNAQSSPLDLECTNVASSPVTAKLSITTDGARLEFGSGSSGEALEEDIKNQTLQLNYSPESSRDGYISYWSEILVDAIHKEYRSVEVKLKAQALQISPFRVPFLISERYVSALRPAPLNSYGMSCRKATLAPSQGQRSEGHF